MPFPSPFEWAVGLKFESWGKSGSSKPSILLFFKESPRDVGFRAAIGTLFDMGKETSRTSSSTSSGRQMLKRASESESSGLVIGDSMLMRIGKAYSLILSIITRGILEISIQHTLIRANERLIKFEEFGLITCRPPQDTPISGKVAKDQASKGFLVRRIQCMPENSTGLIAYEEASHFFKMMEPFPNEWCSQEEIHLASNRP